MLHRLRQPYRSAPNVAKDFLANTLAKTEHKRFG